MEVNVGGLQAGEARSRRLSPAGDVACMALLLSVAVEGMASVMLNAS